MRKEVILGDCIEELSKLEADIVDLIIADPPYWKVIGQSWDYQWRKESDYVEWAVKWISECSRVLRLGGSFYLFGYFRTLALLVPYLEGLGLELRQQIIVDKGLRAISGRATKGYKMFPNVTESILFIVKDSKPFIKQLLKHRQSELGLTAKQINEKLGVKSNGGGMWSIYTGVNVCEQVPTMELWSKLQEILEFDYPYSKLAQTFNPQLGFTDVWRDIDFYNEERFHPTQKPLKLIRRLIEASSKPGDLVLDPFVGGGSTAIVSEMTARSYIAIDCDPSYVQVTNKRLKAVANQAQQVLNV